MTRSRNEAPSRPLGDTGRLRPVNPIIIAEAGHEALRKIQKQLSEASIETNILCPPGVDPGKG